MPEVRLERHLKAPPARVFEFVSRTENLLKWWGPEEVHVTEHRLSFETTGPWMSVMVNAEGRRFKVSGQVTHVDPPNSIGFTWAWHDENDRRGVESHVTIRLVPAQGGGTDLTLDHTDLPDDETARNHTEGWTSSLRRLEALAGS
ncbi:SRPBCC domain-containing protein [Psychromarinibacter sp. C21-152]|uniref:SRPBCC domain-containing protein n=1 Tax=Psychromarinibacter sediminicola TaxID=3033385 RepID=A0AAE3T8W5_9RHOB|nr:SRPBCC domain-containing protein [Psychromarinibacter sediminicola]MDF0601178.1 SRPBCC domain-containing protein [Psychromarinibacter sediminicola]